MSDSIDLVWAKLPSFNKNYHEASNDALVAFTSFLPPIVFQQIKPYWEGYVFYNNKKTGVYKIEVIESLLKETYCLNLEGAELNRPVSNFPGSLIINKILNICQDSTNAIIAKMSYKQRQILIYTQIKRDLWALFQPSEIISPEQDSEDHLIIEDYKSGEWTAVRANKYEKEYDFNLTEGKLHYEDFKKNEQGEFQTYHRVAYLKNQDDIHRLMKFVIELKKYGKNVESFHDFDFVSQWGEGFDGNSFEPKKLLHHN